MTCSIAKLIVYLHAISCVIKANSGVINGNGKSKGKGKMP